MFKRILFCLVFTFASAATISAQVNLFRKAVVTTSSTQENYPSENINDGRLDRSSTWMSNRWSRPPHIVEINLPNYCNLDSIVIYTGIPRMEMRSSESVQAAGYWCVKNFIIQYWDDANWTDMAETVTTENRNEKVVFHFITPVTSFRFRLCSSDGEPIRIVEIEGYGREDSSLSAPPMRITSPVTEPFGRRTFVSAEITPHRVGRSMKYVGYNQAYFVPGSNVSAWWEYSGVNAARVWADLPTYVPESLLDDFGKVESLDDFERCKERFLSLPLKYVKLDSIAVRADRVIESTNTMSLSYALKTLKELGIEVVIQSGNRDYSTSWQRKWILWQRFYNLAFYAAKVGDVEMFAMNNEPNHRNAGPMPLDTWIALMRISSDAVHCALDDVNRLYGKSLRPQFVGPVTAGTNTNWWAAIAAAERIDYRGKSCDHDLIDVFSTHSYNIPAAGYSGRIEMIDNILRDNHPLHSTKPIVFTETGRWMNAYLIDKEETMDSPSLFTEWAGMYTKNMMGGCYGMWAFKFGTTRSGTYPRGIKSGHHYIWRGNRFAEDAFDNLALDAKVTVTGNSADAAKLVDGDKSDSSSWTFDSTESKQVQIELSKNEILDGIAIYSGSEGGVFTAPDRVRALKVEYLADGVWKPIDGASDTNSRYAQIYYTFSPAVSTSSIRITIDDKGSVKLREIKLFGENTLSSAEQCYDVSGVQRTAEVVRLFANGFKEQRDLLDCRLSVVDPDFDMCAARDSLTGNIYVWLVQRNRFSYDISLNLRGLGVEPSAAVVYESVSADSYGEADILHTSKSGLLRFSVPAQSVGLLTITPQKGIEQTVSATACASVKAGRYARSSAETTTPTVEMNARTAESNNVTYITYDLSKVDLKNSERILLGVHGSTNSPQPFRFHIYLFDGKISSGKLCWNNAPYLDMNSARAISLGKDCFVGGEMAMTTYPEYHFLDVTDAIKRHIGRSVTFMLVRELRESGDDYDNGHRALISGMKSEEKPVLKIW